jgi:dienelactone hydrolase
MAIARLVLLTVALTSVPAAGATSQTGSASPDTVLIRSGALTLHALLWHPAGRGPFPAVLFNHGSGPADSALGAQRMALGPLFARHGYVCLFLFRRGAGLSAGEGTNSYDRIRQALADKGQEARNRVQMELLEGDDLSDVVAGLAFLRSRPEVDARRVAVAGHSFGGSLTLVVAERDTTVRAALVFGGAAGSWDRSPALRARLGTAVRKTTVPVFLIYAANDYTTAPAKALAAEMERAGRPHRVKIYPPSGRTPAEGHDLVYREVPRWEPDVFAFLDQQMRGVHSGSRP